MANSKKLISYDASKSINPIVPTSINGTMVRQINNNVFDATIETVTVDTYSGDITGAPWGAQNVVWNKEPKCTISFNENTGSGIMNSRLANIGLAYKIPECTFSAPIGKEFNKWAIDSPSGIQIDPGTYYAFNNSSTLYAIWKDSISYNRVGGRIYYINPNSTGAVYTFYDQNLNIISDQTISGLINAYYYTLTGTPSADKFYVCNISSQIYENPKQTITFTNGISTEHFIWGGGKIKYNTTDGIGQGKINTNIVLNNGIPTTASPNIWEYVQYCRNTSFNGCNDWYIASKEEQIQLKNSNIVTWYNTNWIWTSVEFSTYTYCYYWNSDYSYWGDRGKNNNASCFVARSF